MSAHLVRFGAMIKPKRRWAGSPSMAGLSCVHNIDDSLNPTNLVICGYSEFIK